MNQFNVRRKHGGHQTHPLYQDGQGLVVMEEDIRELGWPSHGGNRSELTHEADRLSCRIRGIDQFREVIDEGNISGSQGVGEQA